MGLPLTLGADTLPQAIDRAREGFEKYPRGSERTLSIYKKVAEIRITEQVVTEYIGEEPK